MRPQGSSSETLNRAGKIALVAVVLLFMVPLLLSERDQHLAVEIVISALFAMSLGLIMGQGGMISLGHAAFFGIGGYSAGLMLTRLGASFWATLLVAPPMAALAGGVMGVLAVRRSHTYLLMLTFALGMLVYAVFFSLRSLTGGDDGLIGIRPPAWLQSIDRFYWFALIVTLVSIAVLYQVSRSPFGYSLRAARDSSRRALASGIAVRRQQIAAFVLAALRRPERRVRPTSTAFFRAARIGFIPLRRLWR
jgi:branched-chain amino acid transport system permease protein